MGKKNKKKLKNGPILERMKLEVENMIVNDKEHKIMWKYREWLQKQFNVQICLPRTKSLYTDLIFASIEGIPSNINHVKRFLNSKSYELRDRDIESPEKENVEIITVSDSDNETESKEISDVTLHSEDIVTLDRRYDSKEPCGISVSENNALSSSSISQTSSSCTAQMNRRKRRFYTEEASNSSSEVCSNEINSTTDKDLVMKKARLSESVLIIEEHDTSNQSACTLSESVLIDQEPGTSNQSVSTLSQPVLIIEEPDAVLQPALDFIPITQKTENVNKRSWFKSASVFGDDDIQIIDEPKQLVVPRCLRSEPKQLVIPRHLRLEPMQLVAPRRLRPIVIDGSNVAMEHGIPKHCFSIKGIKLAIDYFLNRGHTKITAFIPKFRKSWNPNRSVPTTDVDLLEEFEKCQRVVYTPSRRVDGKFVSSYDDRFIVKLAASSGGVILSNDNYRDLLDESEEFKEAIEKRLLQYCFVDDLLMIPDDPLGRNGPKLDEYLSFPPENQ